MKIQKLKAFPGNGNLGTICSGAHLHGFSRKDGPYSTKECSIPDNELVKKIKECPGQRAIMIVDDDQPMIEAAIARLEKQNLIVVQSVKWSSTATLYVVRA